MGGMFLGLTMEELVACIGHDQWKGAAVGEMMIFAAFKPIDVEACREALFAKTGKRVEISVKDEEAPGGICLQMYQISVSVPKYKVTPLSTETADLYEQPISAKHGFFLMSSPMEGEPELGSLKIDDVGQRRHGTTGDGKGFSYLVTRVS